MATIHDFGGRESLQYAVARRLRGLLGELNMAKTEFAELLDLRADPSRASAAAWMLAAISRMWPPR